MSKEHLKKGNAETQFSGQRAVECGRKGGIKSVESRREKKLMRETLETLLTMPMKSGKCTDAESIKNLAAIKGKNIDVQTAMTIAMIQKTLKGDVRAAEWVRDTIGQKPDNNTNLNMNLPVIIGGEDELE